MTDKIKELERIARQLEIDPEQRKEWNAAVQQYADHFLDNQDRLSGYERTAHEGKFISEMPIGEKPHDLQELLNIIWENVDLTGINPSSGRHFGYIPGGGIFPTALADYLAAVTNRYAGMYFANPGAVRMENQLIRWLCEQMGYPKTAHGNLTSGGSIANLTAIVTARDKKGIKAKEVERAVVYLTRQVHHCVQKALRIAGLGDIQIRYIPIDAHFRMDVNVLQKQVEKDKTDRLNPFLVVGSAGTTDVGAVDPLDAIADIAEANDMWYHVDGAYGGAFALAKPIDYPDGTTLKDRLKGIERSDSVAIDPHKGLFLSYGLGAILIKDVQAMYDSHFYKAGYLQDALGFSEWSPADLSPELTKHFRGLRLWLSLQLLGVEPFRAALTEKIELCRYFYKEVQSLGFEVGPYPDLSVMIYHYMPAEEDPESFNRRLLEKLLEDGRFFVSSTTINDTYWLRLAVLSFRTHLEDIQEYLRFLKKTVQKLEQKALTE